MLNFGSRSKSLKLNFTFFGDLI